MKTLLISLAAAVLGYFLPATTLEPIARVLVPAVALLATGIVPCMTLAVNAMKGEQRTPALVEDLHDKLAKLLRLLVASFALSVAAVTAIATTVALVNGPVLDFVPKIGAAVSASFLCMLGGRAIAVGRAFFALLEINRTHALLIARAKVRSERDNAISAMRGLKVAADDDRSPRALVKAE